MQKEKRKRKNMMCVYVTDEEYQEIINSSEQAGLSVSTFARNVCLGYKVGSKADILARKELREVNADLGRLGGLLKLAITEENRPRINFLLNDISKIKNLLKVKIERI